MRRYESLSRIWIFHSRIADLDVDFGDICRIGAAENRRCQGNVKAN
jgi:hypothetical protein